MMTQYKKDWSWIILLMLLWIVVFWILAVKLAFGTMVDSVKVHRCLYKVTFVVPHSNGNDSKTITITVNRPVTLKRINDFWLQPNDGADLNEDGIVNFKDYALWAKED